LCNYELLMGDSRVVIPVIVGILITGLLFASNFEQNAYAVNDWGILDSGLTIQLRSVDFIDTSNGFAVGLDGTIIKTTDGGATWTSQNSGTTQHLLSVDFIDANNGLASGYGGTILKTTNGGTTWTSQNPGITSTLYSVDFIDANNGFVVGTTATILKTTDGGISWTKQNTPLTTQVLYSVDFIDANNGLAVGFRSIILKTTNGGTTWTAFSPGYTQHLLSVDFIDANNAFAVGHDGLKLKSTNGGSGWAKLPWGDTLTFVDFIDANNGYTVGALGLILKTTNGGSTWAPQNSGTTSTLNSVDFINVNNAIAVGLNGVIVQSPVASNDADRDGFRTTYPGELDCDDTNPAIYPGATEIPNNGIDEDCDGIDSVTTEILDADGDGYTTDGTGLGLDCDDGNPAINPGATEILNNGIDEDCDGSDSVTTQVGEKDAASNDADGDGFTPNDGDCDDSNKNINPDAEDIPDNGIDEDCDGVDELSSDEDGDDFAVSDGDCNDFDPNIYPGATEIPDNGIDEDCDGVDATSPDKEVKTSDFDGDGIPDSSDNCKEVSNKDQTDSDKDGVGDACDSTPKGDTVKTPSEEPTQDPESISAQEPAQEITPEPTPEITPEPTPESTPETEAISSPISVSTAKPSYEAGQTIQIFGHVDNADRSSRVILTVLDPTGDDLEDKDKRVRDDGSFETKWKDDTTEDWELTGVYTITAEFEDLSASTTFYFTGTDGPLPPSVMQQGMNIPGVTAAPAVQVMPPLKQMKMGVLPEDVSCNEEMQLIFKSSDGSPKCVWNYAAEKLVARGWATL